jgi:putative glycosyltransferase
MAEPGPALSIVTSLYCSAPQVEEFCRRATAAAVAVASSYEILLVNDGSPDDSLAVALGVRATDARVRIVDLSRNFGHHKALMTGLKRSSGRRVFLVDSDLEEDPGWLPAFGTEMDRTGADVVYGVQRTRKGPLLERVTGALFFRIVNGMLTHPIPENVVTARLMTRRYVDALVQHEDREVFLAGLWMLTGFSQVAVAVTKQSRGTSSYTLRRRVSVLVNAVTSLSNRPLIYIFYSGAAIMLLSVLAGVTLLTEYLTGRIGQPGWASLMISIWFLGGLTVFSLGIIGVYLAKVFTETKRRPYTVVRADYGGDAHDS